MTNIIITSIICISVIIIVGVFCYTNYKNSENARSNRFFKTVNDIQTQYEIIRDDIMNVERDIKLIKGGIDFINQQINNKNG